MPCRLARKVGDWDGRVGGGCSDRVEDADVVADKAQRDEVR